MNTDKLKTAGDSSTEEKIKNAARTVFHKKGFAAARTRDIAEEAGINLALLNYYFRSKEKLFNIVMLETFQSFFASVSSIFNNPDSGFEEKIEQFASRYIDLLFSEPEIPLFIINEIRNNPEELIKNTDIKHAVFQSVFAQQYKILEHEGKIKEPGFINFMMNLMGLIVFPFVAAPLLKSISGLTDEQFNAVIETRKKLIPVWMKAILEA